MKDVKSQASKNAAPGKQGGLNAEIQARIGHQLRAMYDDVVRQGVPGSLFRADPKTLTTQRENPGDQNDGRD